MRLTLEQLTVFLPLLIIGVTVIIVMLSIVWNRRHFLSATLSVAGLSTAFVSLWFIKQVNLMHNSISLICADVYAILFTSLVILASIGTCIFSFAWLENYTENKEEFYLLILIATLGGVVLANAIHMVTLLIGIELIAIPLSGLIGYTFHQKYSLEASIKHMILSSVASSFLMFGVALLYIKTSNLAFITLGKNLNHAMLNEPLLIIGLSMVIVGIAFKLSLVPFHLWTPDVYQGAPAPVSAFLATMSKVAIFSVVMRLFIYTDLGSSEVVRIVLSIISIFSMVFGNLMALNQSSIKRLLGYSSIAHMGYLLVALITSLQGSNMSIESANAYLISYFLSSFGAFGVISLLSSLYHDTNVDLLSFYRGLFWYHPILSIIMMLMMFSLAGIPMTLGFIGKLYIIAISVQTHLWWLTIGVLISSVIGLCYYLRIVVNLYLKPEPQQPSRNVQYNRQHCSVGSIMVIMSALLILIFGIYPQPLINIAQYASPFI